MQTLKLSEKEYFKLGEGKSVTIRKGKRDIRKGLLNFRCDENGLEAFVRVREVEVIPAWKISDKDIEADGFQDLDELFNELAIYYPDFVPEDTMTVIRFDFHLN